MGIFKEIHDKRAFDSWEEYQQIERNLASLIKQGFIVEVPVKTPISPLGFIEHWYQEKATGEIFRYLPPDFPVLGMWEKVESAG